MDHTVIASPPLVEPHPRLSGVELWRTPRTGTCHLIVAPVALSPADLVDLGEWLAEQGREREELGSAGC